MCDFLGDEPTIVISSDEQLNALLKKYDCKDKEQLDDALWFDYGICLIDSRK